MNRAFIMQPGSPARNFLPLLARILGCLFLTCIPVLAQSKGSVSLALTEQGQAVPGGLVVLQRLKDAECARLFNSPDISGKAIKKAEACTSDLPDGNTDTGGAYTYQQLAPGWYDIRFLWSMQKPPDQAKAIACKGSDWGMFYEPGRDRTGKYDAMVQGRPFELKEGESRQISFDYRNQFEAADCLRRMVDVQSAAKTGRARLSIPGHRGVLEIDPGPTSWQTTLRKEGNEVYLDGMRRRDHLLITAFLTQVPFPATAEKCRSERWRNAERALRSHDFDLGHIRKTTENGIARVEFFVERSSSGGKMEMKDVHTYMGSADLCAEVHLSKVLFQPEEQKLFEEVLNSVRFLPDESAEEPARSK